MKLTRRDFVRQLGVATGALGLGSIGSAGQILAAGPSAVTAAGAAAGARHHMLMITLRGGYDSIQSIDPKDPSQVGDHIHCGYMGDERIRGSRRLFGPLIGGLERHDEELCLIHGVRSDTTQMQPARSPNSVASVSVTPDSISQFRTLAACMSRMRVSK